MVGFSFLRSVTVFYFPLSQFHFIAILSGMRLKLVIFSVLLFAMASAQQSKRVQDNSDWWSVMRTDEPVWNKPDQIRTPEASLQILGISLLDPKISEQIERKMGRTVEIDRGDAATGRHQFCYVSVRDPKTYLTFEFGSEYCKSSDLVNDQLSTASGLRIGLSRSEVEKVLGKPTLSKGERITYVRTISVKSTPEELKRARTYAPDMNGERVSTELRALGFFNIYRSAIQVRQALLLSHLSRRDSLTEVPNPIAGIENLTTLFRRSARPSSTSSKPLPFALFRPASPISPSSIPC
jgi:hypothetical protein